MLKPQDLVLPRTAEDVMRRLDLKRLEETLNLIERIRKEMVIDSQLSITSTFPVQNKVVTENLNRKVNKVEGKGLSQNDFTDEYKEKLINQTFDLENYVIAGLTVNNSSCEVKNNRVTLNFSGGIDMLADTLTTIMHLPSAITPIKDKYFIAMADYEIGAGIINTSGNIQLKFSNNINDKYIRFSVTYDLEEVEE